MGKNNNIIEINGTRYDSRTGAVLSGVPPAAAAATVVKPVPKHKPATKPKPAERAINRQPAKHVPAHQPATTHTLMRQAVKKPAAARKQQLRAYGPSDPAGQAFLSSLVPSTPVQSLDNKRLQKAAWVAKSQLISHFSPVTASDFAPAAVRPVAAATPIAAPAVTAALTHPTTAHRAKPTTTAELLEQALRQATSHQQPPPAAARHSRARAKHRLRIGAAITVPLVVLTIIAAQNLPGIRLQMASAEIGFSAKLPDYRLAGFSQGPLQYSPGVVAAMFHSNSDDREYTVTQKRSSWDSATLCDSFVAPSDANYQTVEAGGRTIYLYGQRNATWVSGGIWYVIQADGSIGDSQLVRLASSL